MKGFGFKLCVCQWCDIFNCVLFYIYIVNEKAWFKIICVHEIDVKHELV